MILTRKRLFTKWCLFYFATPLVALFICRLVFFLYYFSLYKDYAFFEIIFNLLHGIRFDLALTSFLYGVPFFLLLLFPSSWQITGIKVLSFCLLPVVFLLIFVQLTSIAYFEEASRHISFEVLFLFSDFWALLQIALQSYKMLILFSLFVFTGLIFLLTRLFWQLSQKKPSDFAITTHNWFSFSKEVAKRIVIFLLIVFFARGGWQLKPLSITHAFYHGDQKLGNLALSAPFTLVKFLSSWSSPILPKKWLATEVATQNTKKLLSSTTNRNIFLAKDYPFYRKFEFSSQATKKKNLIIIIMESWGANYIHALGGDNPEVTPNFNKMSKQGLLFDNFFATGNRSVQGVSSTIFSLPSIEAVPIYRTPFAANNMSAIPLVLAKAGYESIFFHAGHEGSLYLHNLARVAKYHKVFSLDNLENTKEKYDGTWGLWDHFALEDFIKELNKLQPPFHGLFFSLTSHAPFNVPSQEFKYFTKSVANHEFLNSLRYSDWALGQFFKQAKEYDWYQDTIFLIVADHSRGVSAQETLDFQIPFFIYSPTGEFAGKRSSIIGSHVDILPTALSLLRINQPFAASGKDLFGLHLDKSFALISTSINYWITPNYVYYFHDNSLNRVFTYPNPQEITINSQDTVHQENIENFLSFFQTSFETILNNKIIPQQ